MRRRCPLALRMLLVLCVGGCGDVVNRSPAPTGSARQHARTFPAKSDWAQFGPESGEVDAGMYSNEYFGLRLPIPEGWYVADKDVQEHMKETGARVVSESSADLKAAVEVSRQHTYTLLSIFQHPPGAPVDFNPNVILMAERVAHLPGIRSGNDYLFHTKKALSQMTLPYEHKADAFDTQIGDNKWGRSDFLLNLPTLPIEQAYLATKRGDFVLLVILTAASSEQMLILENVAASLVFDEALSN